ncbi:hypothetical protein HPB47_008449 [Ixodes persulcatus]|uniref:Uncharacterized protein n=1 Tax=Ixodes persulcatus TaxID=34615 RepID=A0AC60P4N3_IXOPE|nr:hypothetical protein HPB47_008449 [Ixodes persulcatus]
MSGMHRKVPDVRGGTAVVWTGGSDRFRSFLRPSASSFGLRFSLFGDFATGRVITVPLLTARLRPKAVPSKFSEDLNSRKARSRRKRLDVAAREKAVAESIDTVLDAVCGEEETDRNLSVTDKRQLRPRQKRQYVDVMHDEDPIETALNTSCSQEETNGTGSVKDQDARRRHPKKTRPRRKRQRQASSDSDYMQPDMDTLISEEEADGMLNAKDPNLRQKRPRHTSPDSDDIQRAINESLEEADKILDLKDLAGHVRSKQCSTFWHAVEGSARLLLVHIVEDEAPWIKYSVVLKADLTLTCFVAKTPVIKLGSSLCIPTAVKSKRALMELLECIENLDSSLSSTSDSLDEDISETVCLLPGKLTATPTEDKAAAIQFLREQFNLLSAKKEQRRYSVDFMVFSCVLFTISPHAYKYICSSGNISLPHPMIIRSVCLSSGMNSQPLPQSATFLRYVAKRISDLDDKQRLVTLMVDEIHIKPFLDYKGGSTTDVAPNSTEVASSVLVFTVQSLTCQFKEVAHIVPMQRADAQFLHKLLIDLICGLEKFHTEPIHVQRMLSASFATIRDLYNLENYQLVRYGYSLSREALCPVNTERQNVKLALQIFNDSLPKVLRALGAKHNLRFFEETASFIEIIVKWWRIVNVKAPDTGTALRDQFQEPVFPSEDDPKVDFLYKFLDWLDEWKDKDLDSGTFTSETHAALQHTTHAMVEVARYCFTELKLSCILLGKIQTDNLEERFGNSKCPAGPRYHNSIRKLHEENDGDEQWEDLHKREHTFHPSNTVGVTGEALSKLEDTLPVLVYVAGYAVRATLERLNCVKCRPVLSVNKAITISVAQQHFKLVKELGGGVMNHVLPRCFGEEPAMSGGEPLTFEVEKVEGT